MADQDLNSNEVPPSNISSNSGKVEGQLSEQISCHPRKRAIGGKEHDGNLERKCRRFSGASLFKKKLNLTVLNQEEGHEEKARGNEAIGRPKCALPAGKKCIVIHVYKFGRKK